MTDLAALLERPPEPQTWSWITQHLESLPPDTRGDALALAAGALAGWSPQLRRAAFTPDLIEQPWWPLVRSLSLGDAEELLALKGAADHITHLSIHEDAGLSFYDLEDLAWLPQVAPGLRYLMLDGPNEVASLAALAALPQLQDVALLGYSSLNTAGLEALNALPALRRLVVWDMAVQNADRVPLTGLERLELLQLPSRHLLALPPEALTRLHTLSADDDLFLQELAMGNPSRRVLQWIDHLGRMPALRRVWVHFHSRQPADMKAGLIAQLTERLPGGVAVEVLDDFQGYWGRVVLME
ncbi:MAG: hypothetical protein H6739_27655 [Alphaproteobacteria bacterium]|nr:hypothetical protein [Alphaproteobacteria bacterium]